MSKRYYNVQIEEKQGATEEETLNNMFYSDVCVLQQPNSQHSENKLPLINTNQQFPFFKGDMNVIKDLIKKSIFRGAITPLKDSLSEYLAGNGESAAFTVTVSYPYSVENARELIEERATRVIVYYHPSNWNESMPSIAMDLSADEARLYLEKGFLVEVGDKVFINNTSCKVDTEGLTYKVDDKTKRLIELEKNWKKDNKEFQSDESIGCFGYHSKRRKIEEGAVKLGIEIEKINKRNFNVNPNLLLDKTKIIKESDSSLGNNGAEYVTPAYNFSSTNTIMKKLEPIKHIVNLPFKKEEIRKAGGHMNLSIEGKTGFELLDLFKVYLPLLYAIYPDRAMKNSYSMAKSTRDYKANPAKNAMYPKSHLLEFRVFPAIDDWNDLKARVRLLKYMVDKKHSRYSSVISLLTKKDSDLYKIVNKLSGKTSVEIILKRYIAFSKVDEVKLTTSAKKIVKEIGYVDGSETKFTFKEAKELMNDLDNVPSQLQEVMLDLKGNKAV